MIDLETRAVAEAATARRRAALRDARGHIDWVFDRGAGPPIGARGTARSVGRAQREPVLDGECREMGVRNEIGTARRVAQERPQRLAVALGGSPVGTFSDAVTIEIR